MRKKYLFRARIYHEADGKLIHYYAFTCGWCGETFEVTDDDIKEDAEPPVEVWRREGLAHLAKHKGETDAW